MSRLVVADTGPVNYLVLIGQIDVLPKLFEQVVLPRAVWRELNHAETPREVLQWLAALPPWIEIRTPVPSVDPEDLDLGAGEVEAIAIAIEMKATLLLLDDRAAVTLARGKGLRVTGTLGLLRMAAEQSFVSLPEIIEKLRRTNFHATEALYDQLLAETDPDTGRSR